MGGGHGTIKSSIEMKDIPEYGILTTDYIDINKGKLLHLIIAGINIMVG